MKFLIGFLIFLGFILAYAIISMGLDILGFPTLGFGDSGWWVRFGIGAVMGWYIPAVYVSATKDMKVD